jgi:hypothetical protein
MKKVKNVAGLIFWSSVVKDTFIGIAAWQEKGCPADCTVFDSPTQLVGHGLTVCDGKKVGIMYVKGKRKPPEVSHFDPPKAKPLVVLKLAELKKPSFHANFIYFDESKHKKTQIGTAGPSKISKS